MNKELSKKYLKYKLKYLQLKEEINQQKTTIDKINPTIFSSIMNNDFKDTIDPLFCNALVQFIKITLELFKTYPPEIYTYIFLGQSPIIINIIAETISQYNSINFKYRGLPISNADYPIHNLSYKNMLNIYKFFDHFNLNTINGNCIIIDYVDSGTSLSNIAILLSKYIIEQNIDAKLQAVGLSANNLPLDTSFQIEILYMKPKQIDSEEDAGIKLLTAKTQYMNGLRLYKKIKLLNIINDNFEIIELDEINIWLKTNLNSIISIVKSILEDNYNVCHKLKKKNISSSIKQRDPFMFFNIYKNKLEIELKNGKINNSELNTKLILKLKQMLDTKRITEIQYSQKIKELELII